MVEAPVLLDQLGTLLFDGDRPGAEDLFVGIQAVLPQRPGHAGPNGSVLASRLRVTAG